MSSSKYPKWLMSWRNISSHHLRESFLKWFNEDLIFVISPSGFKLTHNLVLKLIFSNSHCVHLTRNKSNKMNSYVYSVIFQYFQELFAWRVTQYQNEIIHRKQVFQSCPGNALLRSASALFSYRFFMFGFISAFL